MDSPADRLSECLRLIDGLVGFATESSKSNLSIIKWIEGKLTSCGAACVVVPNASGDKAAIFATFGPAVDGGVVLSGHTDVVPVAGQAWTSDPFKLRREGSRLYGRGACDMKGFLGAAMAMAPAFAAASLRRPIHLLFTYDEETTCLGPVDTIARFGKDLPHPGCVIVGEPTSMQVVDAHKAVAGYVTHILGKEAHSSRPALGANAIQIAAELIEELYRIGANLPAPSGRFDPPGSTINAGSIRGGTARNILARDCWIDWEFRAEPDVPRDVALRQLEHYVATVALPRLRAQAPDGSIETICDLDVPGLLPQPGSDAEELAFRLTGANRTEAAPFATEAGRFQAAGVPTIVCGPGHIDQAHQADEFIEIDQLDACLRLLDRLIGEYEK